MTREPFFPPLLPPQIDYASLFPKIIKARDIVARYDEAVKRLPNPMLIQRSFETKEAVLSSRIEGTQATLNEVFLLDAQEVETEENEQEKDYREIFNYRLAIEKGRDLLKQKPLGENVIKDLHRLLLNSVRGRNKNPGEFRTDQVYIGKYGATIEQATYVPPPAREIQGLFSNLEKYLHAENVIDPLVQIAIAHYQFEAIHPFNDGNGRVGRILIPLFLYEKGVTAYPNIYISEFLEKHRPLYYELLRGVSEKNDWDSWIMFFLDGIQEQTAQTLEKVTRIEALRISLKNRMSEINSMYAYDFLDALFVNPSCTVKSIQKITNITNKQTIYSLIDKFLETGIISDMYPERERNKVYIFKELYKVIN